MCMSNSGCSETDKVHVGKCYWNKLIAPSRLMLNTCPVAMCSSSFAVCNFTGGFSFHQLDLKKQFHIKRSARPPNLFIWRDFQNGLYVRTHHLWDEQFHKALFPDFQSVQNAHLLLGWMLGFWQYLTPSRYGPTRKIFPVQNVYVRCQNYHIFIRNLAFS